MMLKVVKVALLLALLPVADRLLAHAAIVKGQEVSGVWVEAIYETGEPMAEAQVTVYGPDNPTKPLMTGLTDASGVFTFVPPPEAAGLWVVQVRQAGHGAMVSIPLGATLQEGRPAVTAASSAAGVTGTQRLVMAAAVVWGFVGTALFFSRRGRGNAST